MGCKVRVGVQVALALLAISALSSAAMAATAPLANWRFDEGSGTTASDSSGNNNTGTLTNGPAWATGEIGDALTFNGTSTSVAVGTQSDLGNLYSTGMTVMAWIKPTGGGGGGAGRIVDKDNNSVGWFLAMNGSNQVELVIDQSTGGAPIRYSTSSISLNTWQHVAVTWDGSASGSNIHIYINGVAADGTSQNGTGPMLADSSTPLTIGNRPTDNARGFAGNLDEARIYNQVLTAAEIQTIANDTQPPGAPGGLTATTVSSSEIDLSWTAATDNAAVASYFIERCSGSSCSNFAQIASSSTTGYHDTGLASSTSYTYRIRAIDTAYNYGSYSGTASAITQGGGGSSQTSIANWRFDEGSGTTATDSSGSGNNGTLTNSPAWTTGEIGDALTFNGTNSLVGVGTASDLANLYSTGMTVMAWIKPTGAGGGSAGRIVDKDNNSSGWFLAMNGSNELEFVVDQATTGIPIRYSTSTISLNTWQHVAVTWDGSASGSNIHIYVNGVSADGTSQNGTAPMLSDSSSPLTIGNRIVDSARGFAGNLDEVRIYNQVLSAAQIQAIESDTQPPSAPTGLTASAVSTSEIDLAWTGSTDNVGVTGYDVQRCSGSGCSNFAQVAISTSASYHDTSLASSTSYSYLIVATDAAGNLSGNSNTASATTSGGGGGTPCTASATNSFNYIYNSNGQLQTITTTAGCTAQYTYDSNGNLTGVQVTP